MKRLIAFTLSAVLCLSLAACGQTAPAAPDAPADNETWPEAVVIQLSDDGIGVNAQTEEYEFAVEIDHDIVYYEAGKDFTYGEGTAEDAHSAEEAAAHTVVRITRPGTYVLQGKLSAGQVAVDLGEDAEEDPNAVVTLVLNGVDITCTVAPAVIFYNVYECGDTDDPTWQVDTSAAGANVILAEGTENIVNGSYVARIYKPDSVVLSEDGTQVAEAKKLHKYDAAFYSRMSMNISGQGKLTIHADNEGLGTELHLTINGGDMEIFSGNDGINTNEDGVSVTTVNGGSLTINVTGTTGEGDGIDSNGWLVINGGAVQAWACGSSMDSGLDADMGIYLNGGTVFASGNMTDRLEGAQNFAVFTFAQQRKAAEFTLKNEAGEAVLSCKPANGFRSLLFSAPELTEGTYTLWSGDTQLQGSSGSGGLGFAGPIDRPDWPDRGDKNPPPDVELPPQPTQPLVTQDAGQPPAIPDGQPPEGFQPGGELPDGFRGPNQTITQSAPSTEFPIRKGGNSFTNVKEAA